MSVNVILFALMTVVLIGGITAWVAVPTWRRRRVVRAAILVPGLTLGPTILFGLFVAWVMTDATR